MKKASFLITCIAALFPACKNIPTNTDTCCASKKDSMEIILNIPVKIKPEYIADYKKAFDKCQTGTLQEEACLAYAIFQSYTDSTEFHLFERWTNKAGLDKHMQTGHFKTFKEETKGMNDEPGSKRFTTYVCPCVNE